MKNLSRVVWSEGMYLGPHHFQVQNRYFEDSIRFVTTNLWFESYGLVGLQLDADALRNGTVSLTHARGIFPDGLIFHMPDSDPLPPPRAIADIFPPTRDKLRVMLAVPSRKPDGVNCVPVEDAAASPGVRFWAETKILYDETTGRDEKPVKLGRKNIRLALETEVREDEVSFPIARVMRDGAGGFLYDPEYIPPCVDLAASDRLMLMVQRLVEILEEKSAALSVGKKATGKSWAEFSTSDIARFWMLHAVHAALPCLRHLLLTRRGHPEELYSEMARLAGALCTFALDSHPRSIPLYDHLNLDVCFQTLDSHIRRHLETIVPTNCIPIPLQKVGDYFWQGEIQDQRVLDHARWVFAIYSQIGEAEVILRTPALVKICSQKYIQELVRRALPGLVLTHLKIPPAAISARADTQYFGVSRAGPCWETIVSTRQVGIYVPGELPSPRIELLVVLES
ncbi:MAG: type VI secretion system baseplate subunit TssK [Bryobacteraceae bacterium]|nr:type VI secretion system baseplate subunit TssK [Bryobacteraceae bacterium]MDW8380230.1 type VI secretion system baseplate subunit TssK [Bryobacterales bacterium]